MKRTLKLNRMTLRNLDGRALGAARGGYATEVCPVSSFCVTNIVRETTADTLGASCVDIGFTKVCA